MQVASINQPFILTIKLSGEHLLARMCPMVLCLTKRCVRCLISSSDYKAMSLDFMVNVLKIYDFGFYPKVMDHNWQYSYVIKNSNSK